MLKVVRVFYALAMLVAASTVTPVSAQEFTVDEDTSADLSPAKMQLWCTITDSASNRVFVSDPTPTGTLSHMALWTASSRFVTVVNSRYNLTIRNSDHACAVYRDKTHAAKARDITVSLAQHHGEQIVTIGLD
ncbi:hypothetical protein AA101099_0113 [Neoasaia chiangmaiensis NBRC 101099]|uniref:Uncharacterized protein n=1 Tax=Neoasaia chiangmaiensis TaxID=320497 RepID=A0A1U9KLT3_9PROT|nr:hypothetical protein [Neoasaia chiangmaiensis]AQS86718.1 hypothetical protein A0U93_00750 [Neoasaia chiangmaiensis]GBR35682.1 hypothetical protein AA101099_0113 [Neoasaia chiangmaiensis NBRC 101099]GEN16432.1 hypothetical protein NCH01_28630 [Neoasaia chiangmaiensis]